MDKYFNATKLAEKCGKPIYSYFVNRPNFTDIIFRNDGCWLHHRYAPEFIAWCLTTRECFTFTAREYFGELFWTKLPNPALFGRQFKKSVKRGEVSDIEYVGTDQSKRRDLYRWI